MGMSLEEKTIYAIVGEWHQLPEKLVFVKTPNLPQTKKGEHGKWEWYYNSGVIFYNIKEEEIESL